MKEKILKIILIAILITTLTMTDFVIVGQNIVIALTEGAQSQNLETNLKNVEFDAYLMDGDIETYSKQSTIEEGDNLRIKIIVKDVGILEESKIKIDNSNFRLQDIQSEYIKNINIETNEIEFNQIIAGNVVEINVPIKFEKVNEITKEYISQESQIILTGNYKNDKDSSKKVIGERKVSINWRENAEVTLDQDIDKYIYLENDSTLIQHRINSQVVNNILVSGKVIETIVPEIENMLPENIDILVNGKKLESEKYNYDKQNKIVTIQNMENNNLEKDEYKIIYQYPKRIESESLTLTLNSKIKVLFYTDELVEKEDIKEANVKQMDNRVSINVDVTDKVYKGYFYANSERDTQYQENINAEVSSLEGINTIEIKQMKDYFVNQSGIRSDVNGSTFIRNIKFSKSNLESILGSDFYINIFVDNGEVFSEINKESEWDDNGELIISLEEKSLENVRILCSQPVNIGVLKIQMERYIKGKTGYNKDQLKDFNSIINTKIVSIGEKQIPIDSTILLEDTYTEARLEVSKVDFSVLDKNENVQILAILKSDNEKYDLYKNPYLEIKLPDELLSIDVHSVNILYSDGLSVTKSIYNQDSRTIQIQLDGEQVDFRTEVEEGIQIVINADLTFMKNIPNKESNITMLYKNENANETQYEYNVNVTLNSKYGAILYNNISGYNEENTILESADAEVLNAQLDINGQQRCATVNQSFINNYEEPIDQITIIGNLGENNSNFETNLVKNITTNSENTKIYYSDKENILAEDDSWQENVQNIQNVKSYKIQLDKELEPSNSVDISYQLDIPAQLSEGSNTYQKTNVTYSYKGQSLNTSSGIQLYTDGIKTTGTGTITQEDGIVTEIVAISANKELADGEEIFEGQPVKYTVSISNNTGNDLNNFELVAEHTNVVYYVQKEKKAEITDNPENPEIMIKTEKDENATNITKKIDILKNGETAIVEYQFSPKKKDGVDITGNIKIKADNFEEKVIQTISNKIKDAKFALEILNGLEENYELREDDIIPLDFYIKNYCDEDKKDVILNIQASEELSCIDDANNIENDFLSMLNQQVEVIKLEGNILSLKFANLKAEQELSFCLVFKCNQLVNNKASQDASIYSTIQIGDDNYYSNTLIRKIKRVTARVTATQDTNMKEDIVKIGDKIIYTAEITNEDIILEANKMEIEHNVTEGNAKIEKAYIKKENNETIDANITGTNSASVIYDLKPGEKIQYIAEILVWDNPDEDVNYEETLQSYISLSWEMTGVLNLPLIEYEMKKEDEEDNDYDKPFISGLVWEDSNKNGERDQNEEEMSNIEVRLLDSNTGRIIKNTMTDEDGLYQFDDLEEGNYIVMFVYDSTSYSVTQYQKEGVNKTKNSDVIQKEKDGKIVAMTEVVNIKDKYVSNIDAGFVKNAVFDLSLNKTVKEVVVKNASGVDDIKYDKTKLAKVEIGAKYIDDSIVVVEYEIEIKNEGEVQGYVKDIVDYMPKDLEFSSEINKDWYVGTDGNLHNISVSNKLIKPGESIILDLILTKQMTTQNTGRSVNIAEIAGATNELSIKDKDSVPGNRIDNEDDISTAELLVSIKTGAMAISISVIFVLVLIVIAYVTYKKRKGGK